MKKSLLGMLSISLMLAALAVAPAVQADTDFECIGGLPAGTYEGNIVVPPGQDCFLIGVTVHGNVKALADAQLNINISTVFGNVEGDKADLVNLADSVVHGNISAKEGGPALRPAAIFNCFPGGDPCEVQIIRTTLVNGDIQVEKMTGDVATQETTIRKGNVQFVDNIIQTGDVLFVVQNTITAGNLQVFKNTGPSVKFVFSNSVGGVIQCYENDPPFTGGPNVGRAPDQPPPLMSGKNQCFGTSS